MKLNLNKSGKGNVFCACTLFFFTAAGFEDRFDITFERAKYGQNSGKDAAKCTSVSQR